MNPATQTTLLLAALVFLAVALALVVAIVRKKRRRGCHCASGCGTALPMTAIQNVKPVSNTDAVDCDEVQAIVDRIAASRKARRQEAVAKEFVAAAGYEIEEL